MLTALSAQRTILPSIRPAWRHAQTNKLLGKKFMQAYCTAWQWIAVMRRASHILRIHHCTSQFMKTKVYKDFGATDPNVYGIFTRDFRTAVMECRVLVTVPACLEILVLAPQNRDWVGRIRYAVFDEVHCIGEHDGGDVWERLLLMMR